MGEKMNLPRQLSLAKTRTSPGALFYLVLILISGSAFAQLAGTYTIGSGGTYSTFTEAATALNGSTVTGPVTFNVISGTYTEQFEIGSISGASASNTITFQSQSGNNTDVVVQFSATSAGANYIARLNGADYLTFQNMTFNALGTSYGRIFLINEAATNNTINHCILNGPQTTSTSTNLSQIFSDQTTTNSSNLVISDNQFNDGGTAIYINGVNTGNLADGIEISGNTLSGVRRGIDLGYVNNAQITDNTIQSDGDRGIYVVYGDGGMVIRGNRMTIGSGYSLYINACDGGVVPAGTPGLVANNAITHYTNSSRGIYVSGSTNQQIYYNSVNSLGGTDSRSFEMTGGGNLNVVNNIFSNPAGGYAYVIYTPGAIGSSDFNDYYSTGVNLAYWGNSNLADLSALQVANSKDGHSLSVNPQFASSTNLHVKSAILDSAATPLAAVSDDMDKEPRDALYPDIGADEYIYGFNYAPVITSLPDTVAIPDSLYKYQVMASDRDADTLVYRLITEATFLSIDSTSGLIQGTPELADAGYHEITIEVEDGKGGLAEQNYVLNVDAAAALNHFNQLVPTAYSLSQNYPNPFNPTTTIEFSIPKSGFVTLKIYNLLGQEVTTLVSENLQAGYYHVDWDASQLASSVYYYMINAGEFKTVKKMILLK